MKPLTIFCDSLEVRLNKGTDLLDITPELNRILRDSKIEDGNFSAFMTGSTGSITAIEFEPGVVEDLKKTINELVSPGLEYEHEKAWHDGNGHSHVQAALIGPSIHMPVRKGRLKLGTWQQIVAVNHDNKPRTRKIETTIIGVMGE